MKWFLVLLLISPVYAAEIPWRAEVYRSDLIEETGAAFGLDAPVARLAGQIHQESAWKADAESPYAQGLAQFTPATAQWMGELYPELRPVDPWNPQWAIRAMVRYDLRLLESVSGASLCERWAFTLSSYNGGLSNLRKDQRFTQAQCADPSKWFGHVEHFTHRAGWAESENRHYVRVILLKWEPLYLDNGWPGQRVCS